MSQLTEAWDEMLNHPDLPEIVKSGSRHEIVAKIFENQDKDIELNAEGLYTDTQVLSLIKGVNGLNEAVIDGDHGYDPENIAMGKTTGAVTNAGPAVMGLVRRAIPNMLAFDIAGVQPLNSPTGQIFSIRSMYGKNPLDPEAAEAFHPTRSPNASFSGSAAAVKFTEFDVTAASAVAEIHVIDLDTDGIRYVQTVKATTANQFASVREAFESDSVVEIAEGMATSVAELQEGFNGSANNPWNEMSFRIDKQTVEAKSRQLKAQYSLELAQDLRAVHGLNADSELSSILGTEILLEINRELLLWVNATAQIGKTGYTLSAGTRAGVFDLRDPYDTKGARWAGEAYKALIMQIEKEATEIGRQTGRGAGNFIIASRNVVNALGQTDAFVGPAAAGHNTSFNSDTNKATFAGRLAGKYNVYIDMYATYDYFTVGYKGASQMDAGIYYNPYVSLTPLRAVDPKSFQPVLGFKTRYAIGINPMADSTQYKGFNKINSGMPGTESFGRNAYFRKVTVVNL